MIAAFRAWRIRRLTHKAEALGRQLLEAQRDRDWMHAAQLRATRDVVLAKVNVLHQRARQAELDRDPWLHADGLTCPPCNHDCDEGRDCPRRKQA